MLLSMSEFLGSLFHSVSVVEILLLIFFFA